jgi:hypothetical protein
MSRTTKVTIWIVLIVVVVGIFLAWRAIEKEKDYLCVQPLPQPPEGQESLYIRIDRGRNEGKYAPRDTIETPKGCYVDVALHKGGTTIIDTYKTTLSVLGGQSPSWCQKTALPGTVQITSGYGTGCWVDPAMHGARTTILNKELHNAGTSTRK